MKKTLTAVFMALAAVGICRQAQAEKVDTTLFRWKCNVTFPGYTGGSELRDFPVLLRIPSDSAIHSATAGDSANICFADASGNVLPHEIDVWNSDGESTVWVNVPVLGGESSGIVMYVGGTGQSSVQSAEVWGKSNYAGVWHFSGSAADSSPSAMAHSNVSEPSFSAEGKVGTAFFGDGDDSVSTEVVDSENFDGTNFTLSAWVKIVPVDRAMYLFSTKNNSDQETGFGLQVKDANTYTAVGATEQYKKDTLKDCSSDYVYLTAVFRDGGCDLYANGEYEGRKASGFSVTPSPYQLRLGSYPNRYASGFSGFMDEMRLRFTASGADWVAADYAAQNDPNFADIGELEVIDRTQLIDTENFRRRCSVSIKGSGVDKVLYSFPVLIRIPQGSPVYGECSDAENDLRFTDDNGFVLPHEVDCWNPEGESTVWVRLDAFVPSPSTLWMYYKPNASAAQALPETSVWSQANYIGVWHFSGSAADSSGAGMDGTVNGAGPRLSDPGKIGMAFFGDGTHKSDGTEIRWQDYDYIKTTPINHETFDISNFTMSAWVKALPFGKKNPRVFSVAQSFELTLMESPLSYNVATHTASGGTQMKCANTAFDSTNDFVYLSATYSGGGVALYINGTHIKSANHA
ncbi:MAG: DUF2341 domain-containing protein, partial [Lentisphaerae bacterium]|nr:DUF2341 domain-containing protein [Lentisphaerota bacterium]